MTAVFKRELHAYFKSPVGYVYLAVFYMISGYYFFAGTLLSYAADLNYVFTSLFRFILFLIPLLTMRLFSEDNKNRTDQVWLTAPVSITGVVAGKFLACLTVYITGLLMTILYAVIISLHGFIQWSLVWSNFFAMVFLGASVISVGILISAMTENQLIAAVGAFAISTLLWLVDFLEYIVHNSMARTIVNSVSFFKHYMDFTLGIFSFSNVLFFASVTFIFLFFTVRVYSR